MAKTRKERKDVIIFTVSVDEKKIIVENAREADQSISDYCRKTLTADNSKRNVEE